MKLASGLILGLSILVAGCGSGGSGSTVVTVSPTPTPTPLPPAAYFMVPNRFEAAVSFGAPTSVGFSSTAQNGDTSYTVQLVANGLPAGVSASFSPNPAPARSPFVMTLNATANAAFAQNLPFIVVATRSVDGVQTKVTMVVDSVPPPGQLANNRSDYIRTDGFIREAAYDRVRNLVYVSDWFWNRVQAISPATKKVVQEISLPRPWGLDLSADGTRLLVGTETDQLFVVDPGTFQVIEHHRLPALPGDSVSEFTTALSRQMANGKVLVLSANSLSGFTELIEWDLATNSASLVPLGNAINPSFLLKSTDGTRAVIGNALSPGGAVSYSSATDGITGSFTSSGFMFPIAIAPDGNHAVIVDEVNGLRMYDANLNPLFTVSGGPVGGGITGGVFSADGAKLYLELNSDFHPNLLTIDGHSGALFGIAPAMPVIPPFEELVPSFEVATPLAVDDTGLLFGSLDHGLAIEDTTFFQNLPAAVGNDIFLKLVAPNVGPVNATTRVTFKTSAFDVLPDVWFGSQRGLNAAATITASNPFGSLSVDAPPSASPGPVNVKAIQPNGVEVFDPLAFSYGPSLEFLNSTAGSPAGGETIHLLALGVPTDPTQVQVKFGTAAATVLSASPIGYGPFPNTLLKVSVPPGLPGPADVTITTATGSTTAPRAFRYMADVSDFPSQDRFQSILYDPFRDQVYLAAKSHIDVFSVQNRQFVTAFTPPGLNGTPNFGPLALTPDGSRLLAGNMQDPSVAVINPDAPLGAVAVALPPQFGNLCAVVPSSFAVTNVGTAFVHLATPPGSICPVNGLDMLDLNTLQGSQVTSLTCDPGDVSASRDGNEVIMASSQFVY
ncbi:MAG TPA: hypothetical protein VFL42_01870, partial [Terriglobales bacterium]|nr:hypothetical protein [Terriglobales bacterium]